MNKHASALLCATSPPSPTVAPLFAVPHPPLRVEITDAARYATLGSQWRDLVCRAAEPNAFQHPAVVAAVAATRRTVVLLAWADDRLDGVWAFAVSNPAARLPLRILKAPVHPLAFLATPVIDAGRPNEVLAAMLDAVAADPMLPDLIEVELMGADGPVFAALTKVLMARGSTMAMLESMRRPMLDAAAGDTPLASLSASTRKKLRQHRRKLDKEGAVTFTTHQGPDIGAFVDEFLAMEASGWKGRSGTALAASNATAQFTRAALGGLGEAGDASLMALRLDGVPLAAQIILRCGAAAFTWKTAYDETWASVSPGMLLFEACTQTFMDDQALNFVDSCCYDDSGYMASGWTARRSVARLMFDARPGRSVRLAFAADAERGWLIVRGRAKRVYRRLRASFSH